jgi:3-dehydroquinate synthetase
MTRKTMTAEEKAAKKAALEDMIAEGIRIKADIVGEPEYSAEDIAVLKLLRELGY